VTAELTVEEAAAAAAANAGRPTASATGDAEIRPKRTVRLEMPCLRIACLPDAIEGAGRARR